MDKIKLLISTTVIVTVVATSSIILGVNKVQSLRRDAAQTAALTRSIAYHEEAEKINDYLSRTKTVSRTYVIRETLEAIDKYLPRYFEKGPYSRRDLIAMAMVESSFNQYLVGTHKEFGIFQLMPESCEWAGVKQNQFDIEVNTEMALFVLQKKYEQTKDYKLAIIAYNGLVKKKGKVIEVYWKDFVKARNAVDDILGDTHLSSK